MTRYVQLRFIELLCFRRNKKRQARHNLFSTRNSSSWSVVNQDSHRRRHHNARTNDFKRRKTKTDDKKLRRNSRFKYENQKLSHWSSDSNASLNNHFAQYANGNINQNTRQTDIEWQKLQLYVIRRIPFKFFKRVFSTYRRLANNRRLNSQCHKSINYHFQKQKGRSITKLWKKKMLFCFFRRSSPSDEVFRLIKENNQMNHSRFNKIRSRRRSFL